MLEPIRHPLPMRAADWVYRNTGGQPRFRASTFIDAARRRTGLTDLGTDPFEEGLSVLCSSINHVDLHLFGRVLFEQITTSALMHRLRRVEHKKRHPEIYDRPLNAPVIVVGLPRSGTTALHRLLALSSNARALTTWEVRGPIPGPGLDVRRLRSKMLVAYLRHAAPALDLKHRLDVDGAEECVFLLEDTFHCVGFWMFFPVYDYLQWLLEQNLHTPYHVYRDYLLLFQAQTPEKRLILKAPAHTGSLRDLLAAVPEATIVYTHRDPVPVVGSVNSLFHTLFSLVARDVDQHRVARTNLSLLSQWTHRATATRTTTTATIFDVQFRDICDTPTETVQDLCNKTGLVYNATGSAQQTRAHPQHGSGRHTYSLAEGGLDEAAVRAAFADSEE